MKKKNGLDSLNPLGRTNRTLKQNVKCSCPTIRGDTLENICFYVFVISFITKLKYIFFCHQLICGQKKWTEVI